MMRAKKSLKTKIHSNESRTALRQFFPVLPFCSRKVMMCKELRRKEAERLEYSLPFYEDLYTETIPER